MTANLVAAVVMFAASVLFIAGIVVLAIGAKLWADATAAMHRTRAHKAEADEVERTIADAKDAVENAEEIAQSARERYVPPADEELRAAIFAEREAAEQQRGYSTARNEGFEETPPIMDGGLYTKGGNNGR